MDSLETIFSAAKAINPEKQTGHWTVIRPLEVEEEDL